MTKRSSFYQLAKEAALSPMESPQAVMSQHSGTSIGIPRERNFEENRVAITPQSVALLTVNKYEVIVERGAGFEAKFSDEEYEFAGAKLVDTPAEAFQADIVVKVAFPSLDEIAAMKEGSVIISAIHVTVLKHEQLKMLMKSRITAMGYEYLMDESGSYPVIQSMSEIAGSASILIAAEYLSNVNGGKGVMLGGISGIPPTEVVILGAGTVGLFATRAALGLGASVKVFDNSLTRLRRLQSDLGQRIYTSILHPETLGVEIESADLVIGAVRSLNGRTPLLVSEEMVRNMKAGSVIVDVAIDQGGAFETSKITSHSKPVYEVHGVTHYCVPNIPSRVPRTASYALSNIFTPMLMEMQDCSGIKNYLWDKMGARKGVYLYKGNLTNVHIADKFNIPFKDIDLLINASL